MTASPAALPLCRIGRVRRAAALGFTLLELLVACALTALAVGLAWPAWSEGLQGARRLDAVAALERLHAAQERMRAHQGFYASDLAALGIAPASEQAHWELAVVAAGPERYRAVARARKPDARCPELVIAVDIGFVSRGPAACWPR